MPAVYDQWGPRVLYPENWELTESDADEGGRPGIALETPDGSLLLIMLAETDEPAEELLAELAAGLDWQYEDVEYSECMRQLGPVRAEGREALFFCLDALIQARLLVFDCGDHRIAALYQADSRRLGSVDQVFDAVLAGMVLASAGSDR